MLEAAQEVEMNQQPSTGRLIAILFGIVPLGIGLTVIGFLWFTPFGQFHSPPLFFRIFGTFVALPFVFIGAAAIFGRPDTMLQKARTRAESLAHDLKRNMPEQSSSIADAGSSAGYVCPSCNAPLGDNADVSPSGDAKCSHCGRWFNIHA
jgi:hypothetical protein